MNPIIRNIIAVVIGWFVGSAVNIGLVNAGHKLLPFPGGEPSSMEALAEAMPHMESKYFLFPFLAHAIGTIIGALVAGLIAANNKLTMSLIVGVIFLIGGVGVNTILPAPTWFAITDILLAYTPMALIGGKIALLLSK